MRRLALGLLGAATLLLSACATPQQAMTPLDNLPPALAVADINVTVPYDLKISESNFYYPAADIVWRGDPMGDRRQQIAQLFETGFAQGTRMMKDGTPVTLDIQIKRFHSVTDRTRLSVGGVHHMVFDLTLLDAETGAPIVPTREVNTSLKAYGGLRAIQAERRGQTQKVRVTGYLARLIQQQLGQPITE